MATPGWFEVFYEDNHLLAVNKPAGLPTMGVAADRPSLLAIAKDYIRHKYRKPGNVYLGIVSRLDAPVTGVVLLARTSKAAARLSEQFRQGEVEKIYWAIVSGKLRPARGRWQDWLRHDERHRRVQTTQPGAAGAKLARLSYRRLGQAGPGTLVEICLETGRKHQIRVQCAAHGHPIVGDRKYGSQIPFPAGIALHARRLRFRHPVRREPIELVAPLPASWPRLDIEQQ